MPIIVKIALNQYPTGTSLKINCIMLENMQKNIDLFVFGSKEFKNVVRYSQVLSEKSYLKKTCYEFQTAS